MKQIQRILLHCHCERSRFSGRSWQSDMKCRCEGEARACTPKCITARRRGNLKSSFALLRTRLRRFTPRNDCLLIAFILVSITLCIFLGAPLMEPMIVYGQPTGNTGLTRESGRDPFALPSGVRLLSKGHITSKTQEVSSTKISPASLKINAILISDHARLASIGKHIVTVGDSILDEKILEIRNDQVILGKGDKKRTLLLSQSPVQLTIEGK